MHGVRKRTSITPSFSIAKKNREKLAGSFLNGSDEITSVMVLSAVAVFDNIVAKGAILTCAGVMFGTPVTTLMTAPASARKTLVNGSGIFEASCVRVPVVGKTGDSSCVLEAGDAGEEEPSKEEPSDGGETERSEEDRSEAERREEDRSEEDRSDEARLGSSVFVSVRLGSLLRGRPRLLGAKADPARKIYSRALVWWFSH